MKIWFFFVGILILISCTKEVDDKTDFSQASILISPSIEKSFQKTAEEILTEEINKRTSLNLKSGNKWDKDNIIAIALSIDKELYGLELPINKNKNRPEYKKEGYRLYLENKDGKNILWIIGADFRGIIYGIGKFMRSAEMRKGKLFLPKKTDFNSSPEYAIRGHQFGYRNTANSWDAWTPEQFDQHFREQMMFGANSFENIPFQDPESSPHFKINPKEMEIKMSEICKKYDADYWAWTPAPRDLSKKGAHQEGLKKQKNFIKRCPRLDGLFVPGGDPGDNHPSVLIPYLKDLSKILHKYHPKAGIWVSLQGFEQEKTDYFFNYLKKEQPEWLRGIVNGPSSPPVDLERKLLPEKYLIRLYPDITHTVRCSYPAEHWDQAFALTLGREPVNPQPDFYTKIFRRDMIHTDGFISYSDGTHDDVNKVVWSELGWDPKTKVRDIVTDYCRFFFGSDVTQKAADGIFSLEHNWSGPLAENNGVEKTLELWKQLETENPQLQKNWRWQQLILRAYYDAYIQKRLIYEKNLEKEAYQILAGAKDTGADKAMKKALHLIQKADREPIAQDLKDKVFFYAHKLHHTVGAQTSVEKYQAAGAERGAILDFIDYPLNNRWWLEDEFKKIRNLKTEKEKLERLEFIRNYENPGKGSFYDNISSADAKHVVSETDDAIDYLWENNGLSRKRLSTQLFQFTPVLEYDDLDPNASYIIRVTGYGEALLRANGKRLKPTKYEKGFEEFKEFPLSKELIKDGKLKITFDKPDEEHLNWRKQSRVTDVWILKQ